jgi:hypothetical protein
LGLERKPTPNIRAIEVNEPYDFGSLLANKYKLSIVFPTPKTVTITKQFFKNNAQLGCWTLSICLFLVACNTSSQKTEILVTETRQLDPFDAVKFEIIGTAQLTQGDDSSITIVAEPEILEKILTIVSGNTLLIKIDSEIFTSSLDPKKSIQFFITSRKITSLQFNGNGAIAGSDLFGERFDVIHNGVGDINLLNINYDLINITHTGGGSIIISGSVSEQNLTMRGSGTYNGADLITNSIVVDLSGQSQATIWIERLLTATIAGDAKLSFYGNPNITKYINDDSKAEYLGLR